MLDGGSEASKACLQALPPFSLPRLPYGSRRSPIFFSPELIFFLFFPNADPSPRLQAIYLKYQFIHAYKCTFALGGITIPCSLFTSHFSLAFKCEPSVTRVSNCLSVLVVITDFKAVIYITRGSTVSFNLNRKKNLNNRKNSQGKRMICSLRTNFIVNQLATLTCVSLSLIQQIGRAL